MTIENESDGLKLLHISDLHFGPPYLDHVGEALQRIAPEIGPDCIVVSGDLTQRATREQFVDVRDFLDRLPAAHRVTVPGNHDVPWRPMERLLSPFDLYREHVSDELDTVHELDGAVIVALNSARPHRHVSNGELSSAQLDLCEKSLGHLPADTFKIVVTHHHFLGAPDFAWDKTMPGAPRILDRLIALRVDLIMNGHLHRAHVGNSLDVYRGADREHGIIIAQCGTTTSRRGRGREREKNSFNVIRLGSDRIVITHYVFFEELGNSFAPISHHLFPRPSKRVLRPSEVDVVARLDGAS